MVVYKGAQARIKQLRQENGAKRVSVATPQQKSRAVSIGATRNIASNAARNLANIRWKQEDERLKDSDGPNYKNGRVKSTVDPDRRWKRVPWLTQAPGIQNMVNNTPQIRANTNINPNSNNSSSSSSSNRFSNNSSSSNSLNQNRAVMPMPIPAGRSNLQLNPAINPNPAPRRSNRVERQEINTNLIVPARTRGRNQEEGFYRALNTRGR